MRFLKRKGNGKPAITVVDTKPERRPWVVFRGVLLREWCESEGGPQWARPSPS